MILLSSLPDENYETFILILINYKQSTGYNEVSYPFVNHKLRRKKKETFNSTSAEALALRDRSFSQKGESDHEKSKSIVNFRDLKKNQYVFYKKLGH